MKYRQTLVFVVPAFSLLFASCSSESGPGESEGGGSGDGGRTSGGMVGTAGSKAGSSSGAGGRAGAGGADTTTAGMPAGGNEMAGGDGGGSDAGGSDAGGSDAGGSDAGGSDAGGSDAGGSDAGGNTTDGGVGGGGVSSGSAAGSGGEPSIRDVVPSAACDKVAAPQGTDSFVKYTVSTSGTKADDATGNDGPWTFNRDYYLWLPPGYDTAEPYPLVLQLPGCGGDGTTVYSLSGPDGGSGVDGRVIRVGLTPPPNAINHAVLLNQRCFDDYEGDDSVDVAFYEKLIDELDEKVCYDKNRVFLNGNSTGSTISQQLLCKFAGNTDGYAIRGSITNTGDWRTQPPSAVPTCNGNPVASLFVHESADMVQPFGPMKLAIKRAMQVNGCTIGTDYDSAQLTPYPISADDSTSCRRILGCPVDYPIVVCELPGTSHATHDVIVNAGASTLITQLAAP